MEFITDNLEHIQDDIDELVGDGDMLIIDCPGQIELYTHLQPIQIFIEMLTKLGFVFEQFSSYCKILQI
jgi:hypothetical protein